MTAVAGLSGSLSCVACSGSDHILGIAACCCAMGAVVPTGRLALLRRIDDFGAPVPWSDVSSGQADDYGLERDLEEGLVACALGRRAEVWLTAAGVRALKDLGGGGGHVR